MITSSTSKNGRTAALDRHVNAQARVVSHRDVAEWPLFRSVNSLARALRQVVNETIDVARGRYDR